MKISKELENQWNKEFYELASPIINTPNFQKQKEISHHHHSTIFKHVVIVARICFMHAKKEEFKTRKQVYDLKSLVKGALLHDYFLYNWRETRDRPRPHGFKHPRYACEKAKKEFGLNEKEENMILSHMWPLTFFQFPNSKEAWLLSMVDKKASFLDFFKLNNIENF